MSDSREIIARFGGVDELASLLGKPPSTIRNWHAGRIPPLRFPELLRLAERRGVELTWKELSDTN